MSNDWADRRRLVKQLDGNSSRGYRTVTTSNGTKVPVNVVGGITYDLTTGRPLDPRYLHGVLPNGKGGIKYLADDDPSPSRMTDLGTGYKQGEIDAGATAEKSRAGAGFSDTAISTDNTIIDFSDIGDEYDKGPGADYKSVTDDKPGAGPSDEETRTDQGFPQKGRNLGPKPINIPDFKVNPFEAAGLKTDNSWSPDDAPLEIDEKGASAIGAGIAKTGEKPISGEINAEGAAAIGVDSSRPKDPRPASSKPKEVESYNGEFGGDYGIYEDNPGMSALERGRRGAILNTGYGEGPMAILRARNESMGTAYETDDTGRMTGRTIFNNDGTAEILGKGQDKEYYGDPQKFLKGVMDGTVKIGGGDVESGGETPGDMAKPAPDMSGIDLETQSRKGSPEMYQEEGVPFGADSGVQPGATGFPVQDVDFTDMSSVIPFDDAGLSTQSGVDVPTVGDEFNGAPYSHEGIAAMPTIPDKDGVQVPDFSEYYRRAGLIK